jgi:hypothetical protein
MNAAQIRGTWCINGRYSTTKRDSKADDFEGVKMLNCQLRNKLGKVNVLSKTRDDGSKISSNRD